MSSAPATPPAAARRRRGWRASTVIGLVLLLGGLSILAWAAWQFFGTNITSERAANSARNELVKQWQASPAPKPSGKAKVDPLPKVPGDAFAIVRIPKLGADWEWPLLVGTELDDLARGIGWYETTARPGEVGNFAIAGHRVTHGEPFRRLLELQKGDQVVVETRSKIYTYELDSSAAQLTVQDTEGWVLDPVPGKPSQQPTEALITLTTSQDLFRSPDRTIVFGKLVDTRAK